MKTLERILSAIFLSFALGSSCKPKNKPYCHLDVSSTAVDTTAQISVLASDSGDNSGISWIKLYENGILLKEKNCGNVNTGTLEHEAIRLAGEFEYQALCKDRDENEVWSNKESIVYDGPKGDSDLEITYFVIQGQEENRVVLAMLLRNKGETDLRTDFSIDFGDGDIPEEEIILKSGQEQIIMRDHYYSSGSYTAVAMVDIYDQISETDESNNQKELSIYIF